MRFATLLLLATVSAVRIQHTKPEKDDDKPTLDEVVDFIFKKCDGNGDGTLTVEEAKECWAKAPKKVKDAAPELDSEDEDHLEKIAEDGKITKEELKDTLVKAWKKYGPKDE